jgi:hypothetical protein
VTLLYAAGLVGLAMLGWLAGMLTFRRSLGWCPRDGATLTCPACEHKPAGGNQSDRTRTPKLGPGVMTALALTRGAAALCLTRSVGT